MKLNRAWLAYGLMALHPAGCIANVLDVEPFELFGVVAVESLILALPAAWVIPAAARQQPFQPVETEPDLDGFRARWPVHPGLDGDEAVVTSFAVAFVAAVGGLLWLGFSFPYNRGASSADPVMTWVMAALFGAIVGAVQGVAFFGPRWLFNRLRQGDVTLELRGRDLSVDEHSWTLHHDDRFHRTTHGVLLSRDGRTLHIPATGPDAARLLLALQEARPDPDDGRVPEELAALRDGR